MFNDILISHSLVNYYVTALSSDKWQIVLKYVFPLIVSVSGPLINAYVCVCVCDYVLGICQVFSATPIEGTALTVP